MPVEFTVRLENKPGTLARVGEVLGNAEVNIKAIQGNICEGMGIIQFVVSDPEKAHHALHDAGMPHTTRDVLVINVLDEPGTLGDVAMVMADAGINIDAVYLTTKGQMVLGVDDMHGAMQVAAGMAVTDS